MDTDSCQRERFDAAPHQRAAGCRGDTGGGDDHSEVESVAAPEGYPAKIWYVVRIPAFIYAELLSLAYAPCMRT